MTPQPRSDPTPRGAPHLSPVELGELRERLRGERLRLASLYLEDVRGERAIVFDEAEDDVDRAEKGWTREELSSLAESDRERLRLVEEALERLRDGSYGLCLETGRPIPLARLRVVPWARYLREVQEDVEAGEVEGAAVEEPAGS